jgi:tRNA(fMet)-specific endonuclease VapC
MAVMLDADVLIANERGKFELTGWLATLGEEDIEVAAITAAELWHGCERATAERRARREAYIEAVLGHVLVVPFTETTARIHARVWAGLESAGTMIGYHDLIVAATALERGSPVATFNERHFAMVPGLTVVVPS